MAGRLTPAQQAHADQLRAKARDLIAANYGPHWRDLPALTGHWDRIEKEETEES